MALTDTVLLEYRNKYQKEGYDAFEHRVTNAGAYEYFRRQQLVAGLQSEIDRFKKAEAHAVKVPALKAGTVTIGSARSLTIASNPATSELTTLSFATVRSAFTMIPAINQYNDITYQNEFNRLMEDVENAWLDQFDLLAATQLNTHKAQYLAADGNPYPLTNDELIVPYTDKELVFSEIDHIYKADKLPANSISVIGNTRMMPLYGQMAEYSKFNQQDKTLRLGNKDFYISNNIASEANYPYLGYFSLPNAVGFYNWNDMDAKMNSKAYNGEVSVQMMPKVGIPVAVFRNEKFKDNSAVLTGGERSLIEEWEFSTDIAWLTSYNSAPTTKADPIIKFKIVKEGGIV